MESDTSSALNEQLIWDLLGPSNSEEPALHEAPVPQDLPSELQMVGVEVPVISNPDDYDFLRGHHEVRRILREIQETDSYLIKAPRLETLENGPEALVHFQNSPEVHSNSSDGNQSVTHLSSTDNKVASSQSVLSGRRRRSTRARNTGFSGFFDGLNSDNASDSSDDIITSTTRRHRPRKLKPGRPRKSYSESSNDEGFHTSKGTRFSTRQRNVTRGNLRERFEDDISENEETRVIKFFGARETFDKIPQNDPFRLRHRESCDVCLGHGDNYNAKGPLVFCQGCTSAFHQLCLGPRSNREHLVTKVASDLCLLQCRRCLGVGYNKDHLSPNQGCCTICNTKGPMSAPLRERLTPKQEQQLRDENDGKDPITNIDSNRINKIDNILIRCTMCKRAFHSEHCPETFKSTLQCQECSSIPGEVGGIVAWRPVDPNNISSDSAVHEIPEPHKEYLIKWKDMSYGRCAWMPGDWVFGIAHSKMRRAFFRSDKSTTLRMTSEDAIPESFRRIDIVFDIQFPEEDDFEFDASSQESAIAQIHKVTKVYAKFKGLPYEDSVWDDPPPESDAERWNDFKAAYEDWVKRDYIHTPDGDSLKKHLALVRKQNFEKKLARETQPDIMTGGEMMDYQIDGMNWLYYMWVQQKNAILADEMGLGKTIQVIGFFATLIQYHKCWPFLVVVPNSTCPNWRKEIKTWIPSIRVVTYYGSAHSRHLAQQYEMFSEGDRSLRCHIIVTSYEAMVDDSSRRVLSKVPWAGMIVDEGQRLKNDKSQLYEALNKIKTPFKALLTGTPLQNNTRELFNLLQFCDPTLNAEQLDEEYGVLSKENIPELHNMIRPFFLRRTKAQVLTFLPPVAQIILPVTMSVVQKKLYKSILVKNPSLIQAIFKHGNKQLKQAERHNLNNILMQLRKCLCHPFIYSEAIEERTSNTAASFRQLVDAAGKLKLLELMLPKLHQRGNRVLIFSQFLDNLDIVEDFLDGLGLRHRRLDGKMTSLEKQKMIEDYNAEESPYFAFLLSTRSGGVGINLATADTVIIMDPDFNPHQDMQALSRAHRIGQKNKVLVFQLMTRGSAEEKILQIGKKKMVLDHVLIDRMVSDEGDGEDLESILRHGAQALFDDDDSGDIHYDSESVDKLLDRSQAEQAKSLDGNSESHFSFARVWANNNLDENLQDSEEDSGRDLNPDVWEKLLAEREHAAVEEARRKAETFGRGKRKRTAVVYANPENDASPTKGSRDRQAETDTEFKADGAVSESESVPSLVSGDLDIDRPVKRIKVRPFERVHAAEDLFMPAPATSTMDGQVERRTCVACNQIHPVGSCPLRLAGVEHCGLCGLAHFGYSRTCPHLRSEAQVSLIFRALKNSTEDPQLINQARKYLYGVSKDLAKHKRKKLSSRPAPDGHITSTAPPIPTTTSTTISTPISTAPGASSGSVVASASVTQPVPAVSSGLPASQTIDLTDPRDPFIGMDLPQAIGSMHGYPEYFDNSPSF
ncbi:hypothetical protein FE257_002917 [Aspergillus nanangensis]|uniref:Chromatin remodeling complex subunit n=1 Tax=Aspergillus nanangensis TaxID=2582783 RepID=A0AAD4CSL0_ASPNN|nr:hypothetical protein FE257_002917 [Aspergillus nanangensis]